MFLLDTNVLSQLRRPERAPKPLIAWAERFPQSLFYISAITVLEIALGIRLLERRDPTQAGILKVWFHGQVLPEFQPRTLPVDAAVALRTATLHVPSSRSERDAMIAGTALVHELPLLTRNTSDFAGSGVTLYDPWNQYPPDTPPPGNPRRAARPASGQ
ncbi:twitching motility protein PilT [Allostella sp. ATCC 35155]|nr:twitching motility protein PilT [Stella sp. ATCC 35155]